MICLLEFLHPVMLPNVVGKGGGGGWLKINKDPAQETLECNEFVELTLLYLQGRVRKSNAAFSRVFG